MSKDFNFEKVHERLKMSGPSDLSLDEVNNYVDTYLAQDQGLTQELVALDEFALLVEKCTQSHPQFDCAKSKRLQPVIKLWCVQLKENKPTVYLNCLKKMQTSDGAAILQQERWNILKQHAKDFLLLVGILSAYALILSVVLPYWLLVPVSALGACVLLIDRYGKTADVFLYPINDTLNVRDSREILDPSKRREECGVQKQPVPRQKNQKEFQVKFAHNSPSSRPTP